MRLLFRYTTLKSFYYCIQRKDQFTLPSIFLSVEINSKVIWVEVNDGGFLLERVKWEHI